MDTQYAFTINASSADLDRKLLLDHLLNIEFIMHHDFASGTTSIISDSTERIEKLNVSGLGISVEASECQTNLSGTFIYAPVAMFQPKIRNIEERHSIDDMYKVFLGCSIKVFTLFVHPHQGAVAEIKRNIEDKISKIEVRHSQSINAMSVRQSNSVYTDSYYESYEKRLLSMFLDNLNDILINRGLAYSVSFIIEDKDGSQDIINYLKSNAVVLKQSKIRIKNVGDLCNHVRKLDSIPLSYANASQAVGISERTRRIISTPAIVQQACGDIEIGSHISPGIPAALQKAFMDSSVLNLGTLITGLPGTGKTNACKLIIRQVLKKKTLAVIISPTGEWNEFGDGNSLNIIDLANPQININFFRCESKNTVKFYENLAMLISAGSNSGPYQNSMQNCLLSAFSRVYQKSINPEPDEVYAEIEEAIIEQHAKKTGSGIKYTKHGENIRSGLEGLRQTLMKPQFAYSNSLSFKDLVKDGAVFDLSELSNNLKPLIYALLLNQVYSISEEFDIYGDNETRLIICLEEAQLIFSEENESSATLDLKERIQNFRKNGVALMLITHNINDISPGIRRLCQNKLYFRQSADVAKYAANDLVFGEEEYDRILATLKTLGHRECAINIVEASKNGKNVTNSSFVRIGNYDQQAYSATESQEPAHIDTTIRIIAENPEARFRYEIYYLGERMRTGLSGLQPSIEKGLLPGKKYRLIVLGDKKKDNREFQISGGENSELIMPSGHKI